MRNNQAVAAIRTVTFPDLARTSFRQAGDTAEIELKSPPKTPLAAGMPLYYGPNPNGFALVVPPFATPEPGRAGASGLQGSPAVIITQATDLKLTIRNVGETPVAVARAPEPGDHLFVRHRPRPAARASNG